MKKILLILFLLSPVWLICQDVKNGSISFDFGKNKKPVTDTTQQDEQPEDTVIAKPRKQRKPKDTTQHTIHRYVGYDYKKDGLFFGLFHAGVNFAQIDGDNEYGYKYFGAEGGVGALARFDKIFSLSLELNYSMKGARARLPTTSTMSERYMVAWDYVEAPVAVNAHYKNLLVFTIGIDPGYQVLYKELDYDGINITNNYLANANVLGPPRKFDLCGFGGMQVIFKEHYSIGGTYSYSMIKIRGSLPGDRVNGEYNNYLTLDFKYILGKVKK